jgi:hypothetical protein
LLVVAVNGEYTTSMETYSKPKVSISWLWVAEAATLAAALASVFVAAIWIMGSDLRGRN